MIAIIDYGAGNLQSPSENKNRQVSKDTHRFWWERVDSNH